ncbi:hypothetical protein IU483_13755 [Streptomyces gardneri]|nr:hypothetical protein [Streptomyces gardneri]
MQQATNILDSQSADRLAPQRMHSAHQTGRLRRHRRPHVVIELFQRQLLVSVRAQRPPSGFVPEEQSGDVAGCVHDAREGDIPEKADIQLIRQQGGGEQTPRVR